jgi:hypothetical protein
MKVQGGSRQQRLCEQRSAQRKFVLLSSKNADSDHGLLAARASYNVGPWVQTRRHDHQLGRSARRRPVQGRKSLLKLLLAASSRKYARNRKRSPKGCTRDRERSAERMSDAVVYRNGCIWMLRNEGGDVKR